MENSLPFVDVLVRLSVAALLGMSLGVERAVAGKTAGMRTYALVSMGAALFVVISELIIAQYGLTKNVVLDPLRMASQVVVGIGFLGAGLIIFRDSQVNGLTTAAGLWVASAIGVAAGYGLFEIAIFSAFLTILVFTILWYLEEKIRTISRRPTFFGKQIQQETMQVARMHRVPSGPAILRTSQPDLNFEKGPTRRGEEDELITQ